MHTQEFERLPMPRQNVPQANAGNYRVYKNDGSFVLIHAMSALEALHQSGMADVTRIERDSLDLTKVFAPKDWTFMPNASADVAEAAHPSHEADGPREVVEVPLTGDDVSKLLNS